MPLTALNPSRPVCIYMAPHCTSLPPIHFPIVAVNHHIDHTSPSPLVLPEMMSGSRRRTAAAVLFLFLLATTLLGARFVDGARSMQQTTRSGDVVRPAPAMRLYGGYLPRPRVIPPSGPSEGHNAIGPEDDQRMMLRKP
ncbi:hypothetical protein PAHAL_7G345500 [Panicum hallii]|uniref:Uncharacterized protein n=1 Tax=Panicum hallii TaxID=206008 RepID=A0A2T8IEF5_9POAL|nr:hypothetical protein PAHAL_7G345500 [Panicum hallii]